MFSKSKMCRGWDESDGKACHLRGAINVSTIIDCFTKYSFPLYWSNFCDKFVQNHNLKSFIVKKYGISAWLNSSLLRLNVKRQILSVDPSVCKTVQIGGIFVEEMNFFGCGNMLHVKLNHPFWAYCYKSIYII